MPTIYQDPDKLREVAYLLVGAEYPLVITLAVGRSPAAVKALVNLVDATGMGVVCFNPEYMNFPLNHTCHLGFIPDDHLAHADVILVVDCDVPWYPNKTVPRDEAKIIQINLLPGNYFCTPHAGFLGWAVGAALGAKLAEREKTVIATVGDGSYMFAVPSACHFVSTAYQLPILVIVYNNQSWLAVKRATLAVHPNGWAARTKRFPLSDLQPTARYEKICEAFGGYGERVETPEQIQPALNRALHAVQNEKRQALLNIICKQP